MRSKPGVVVATGLVLTLALVCGCERSGGKYFGTTKPKHGPDEAWTNLGTEPEWIDPGKAADSAGGHVILKLFAGLTQAHPKTRRPSSPFSSLPV